jgi:hypothetical protein
MAVTFITSTKSIYERWCIMRHTAEKKAVLLVDEETAWFQKFINTGDVWRLEGAMGRAAMNLIEQGQCILGREGHKDFWGNYVPSRDEVKAGTKGSKEFAAERQGVKYAEAIAGVE